MKMMAALFVATTLLVFASFASTASASQCEGLPHPRTHPNALSDFFAGVGAQFSPEAYAAQQRLLAARATYDALLAAGAPEPTACAAALNPQVFQAIAPTYLGRR
jgi:hypothetical protein